MRGATELAAKISKTLIKSRSWTSSLEQSLHKLNFRDSLTPTLVSQIIDPYLLNHHFLALSFFNWASQQPGFTHTSITYQSILKSVSQSRQFNAIDALLKQVKAYNLKLDSSTYELVINSLLQEKFTNKAFIVFNEIVDSRGIEVGCHVWNSLLCCLSSDGCLDNAVYLFDLMIERSAPFTTIGFGVFIWRLCRDVDMGRVLSILDKVIKNGSRINGSVIASLIVHGFCRASKGDDAFRVLNELRIRGCKPDFIAYRIVAEGFRLDGNVVDVSSVLKMKRKLGVAPRSHEYEEFILGLIAERLKCEAKELGEVIVRYKFPIDGDVLNALISSVSSIDQNSAIVFFNFLVRRGEVPTLSTLESLSQNLCMHSKIDELLELYSVLSSYDYFSDMERYNLMFSFLCKANKLREAYAVLQEMKRKGLNPHMSMYNSLMESCCREDLMRPAKRLWDEMLVTGCDVDLRTYNILITKFSETAKFEEALRLLNHMLERGVSPDATTYTSLLKGFCKESKFDAAVEVFNEFVNQDMVLAQSILNTFILDLCDKGQFLVASKLLCDLPSDNASGCVNSHVVLLKCLADTEELSIAVEHVNRIRRTSPSVLENILAEVEPLLFSSSKPGPVLNFLQSLYKNDRIPSLLLQRNCAENNATGTRHCCK